MKALVGAFNQEKALVGAFSVIVKTGCGTDGSFYSTNYNASLVVLPVRGCDLYWWEVSRTGTLRSFYSSQDITRYIGADHLA